MNPTLPRRGQDLTRFARRHKRRLIRGGLVVVALIFLLPKATPLLAELLERDAGEVEMVAVSVEAVVPHPGTVYERIGATGNIRANAAVNLSAETSGRVTGLYLREGAAVGPGQLLVKINDSELQAQLSRVQFSLEMMRETEERQRRLLEGGGASREEYNATREELNDLESELELIQAQIATTEIRAPFAGVLGLRYIDGGAYITPSTRIATLQDVSRVRIDFSISERYAATVAPGDSISFRVQGVEEPLAGVIHAVEPQIDTRTRTAQIRAISDNPDGHLRPGAFASVDVAVGEFEEALMIPTTALVPGQRGYSVFVVRDGRALSVPVETGIRTNDKVHVESGLTPADTVLTTGLLQVRDGVPVHVQRVEDVFPEAPEEAVLVDDPLTEGPLGDATPEAMPPADVTPPAEALPDVQEID